MTHKERVLMAPDHQEPDQIPLDLGSVGSLIVDDAYFKTQDILEAVLKVSQGPIFLA